MLAYNVRTRAKDRLDNDQRTFWMPICGEYTLVLAPSEGKLRRQAPSNSASLRIESLVQHVAAAEDKAKRGAEDPARLGLPCGAPRGIFYR